LSPSGLGGPLVLLAMPTRDGNGSVGHGSWVKWVIVLDGSRGSWVTASDSLTNDDEITAQ